jgi:olefin beta-lactone synthetase
MGATDSLTVAATLPRQNVADRLAASAARSPQQVAVAAAHRYWSGYSRITFAELDAQATAIARGLVEWGVAPETKLVLLVRPGVEFVTLVFALLRAGAVIVLVDPGMGRRNLIDCLLEIEPEGFIAEPPVQALRLLMRGKFPEATWNVTVGRRWFWRGPTLANIRRRGEAAGDLALPVTHADGPAAIMFTSGSTGPPKGVLYTHGMFDTQVAQIQAMYQIEPGGVDLSCFGLFALFNAAMGVTTVFPRMDFSRPGAANPKQLFAAAHDWPVTQAFASPAVWRNVSEFGRKTGKRFGTLRKIFSCGAPVPSDVLRATLSVAPSGAKMHTPYGATECLPIATIEAAEVIGETAARTNRGAGICVGRKVDSIEWRIIRIDDDPIERFDAAEPLAIGEIGELIVRGPQASPSYFTPEDADSEAKIADPRGNWHRMGDLGYLDEQGRFWYCGRKSQRVETADGTLFTECLESVVNTHPAVSRSALVGLGPRGEETPVLVVEPELNAASSYLSADLHRFAQSHPQTRAVARLLVHPHLPVDVRHNSKIDREALADWAATQLPELV